MGKVNKSNQGPTSRGDVVVLEEHTPSIWSHHIDLVGVKISQDTLSFRGHVQELCPERFGQANEHKEKGLFSSSYQE